jgi:hypothetical protein
VNSKETAAMQGVTKREEGLAFHLESVQVLEELLSPKRVKIMVAFCKI